MPNISILSGVLTSEILELNYMKSYIEFEKNVEPSLRKYIFN